VLCFLGPRDGLSHLIEAAHREIAALPTKFTIDETASRNARDERMERAFAAAWDRVLPLAWSPEDERAVAEHGSVLFVLGPPMTLETTLAVYFDALQLTSRLLTSGATAAKGESAGVAHGVGRWQELAARARALLTKEDHLRLTTVLRWALARRPIGSGGYVKSVGFHLVGLPEVYVPDIGAEYGRQLAFYIDEIADEMAEIGVEAMLHKRRALIPLSRTTRKTTSSSTPMAK